MAGLLRDPCRGNVPKEKPLKKSLSKLRYFSRGFFFVGRAGFEPAKFSQQIYSLPSLAA
jgi:hypothetical protein